MIIISNERSLSETEVTGVRVHLSLCCISTQSQQSADTNYRRKHFGKTKIAGATAVGCLELILSSAFKVLSLSGVKVLRALSENSTEYVSNKNSI